MMDTSVRLENCKMRISVEVQQDFLYTVLFFFMWQKQSRDEKRLTTWQKH